MLPQMTFAVRCYLKNFCKKLCATNTFVYNAPFQHRKISTVSPKIIEDLQGIVGSKNVSTALSVREQYGTDEGHYSPHPAEAVVFAHSTEDVVQVAKLCHKYSVPMIPHGTGTGLEQGIGALQGGICVDLSQMTSVLSVNTEDFDATVEPGVTWRALNQYLRNTGLMFPVDPGSDASLGGMAATSASGTNAVKYGTMKDNVLNLEVVLADGSVLHTAGEGRRSRKSSAGYNLTNLFVGSEGTLGFITKVTLRLKAIPETMISAVCSFPAVKDAIDAVIQVLQMSVPVARIEFMDEVAMGISNRYSNLDYAVSPSLFLEFHGSEAEVKNQAGVVSEIMSANNGSNFIWAQDLQSRQKLWKARNDIFYATLAQKPGSRSVTTDVCIPISKLTEVITETEKDIKASGMLGTILGHVGDGNFHTQLLFLPSNQEELKTVCDMERRICLRALRLNGTCTGEHGIGIGKMKFLEQEFGPVGIEVMRQVKLALDPKCLMNPGKVFKCTAKC